MDPNSHEAILSFVRSMEAASLEIAKRKPDCIIAPMFGAVPFIDVLNIIDEAFPNDKVEYVPASNKLHRVRDVLRGAFESVIRKHDTPEGARFLSIDEVVSGNSLTRVYKQFDAARVDYANKKTVETFGAATDFTKENIKAFRDSIVQRIAYNSIGITECGTRRASNRRNPEFQDLAQRGIVIPVDTECIVTMDRTEFFPCEYRMVEPKKGTPIYLPVVEKFDISPEYIDFLRIVAAMLGKDTDQVTVQNLVKIRESYKNVPEALRVYDGK
ncbi:hypothetical protein HY493_04210 [Candidatus Woesearchaeota archaeon]|nr:hypothetical protein [Candidatus Woesearchaeota archaeon]